MYVTDLVVSEPTLWCLVGLVFHLGSEFLVACYVTRLVVPFWLPREGSIRAYGDVFSMAVLIAFNSPTFSAF